MSRKETMKVYHGIPKSITDEHTIFYHSMENMPEGFTQTSAGIPFFKIGVTGAYPSYANCKIFLKEEVSINKPITVDLWLNDLLTNDQVWIELEDENNNRFGFQKANTTGKIYFTARIISNWKNEVIVSSSIVPSGTFHIRYVADIKNNIGCVYINGKMIGKVSLQNILGSFNNFTGRFTKLLFNTASLSDLHISNIDRGDYFPNLPQDFIDGRAIIKPRFGQQQIKGDPMYSQYTLLKVPCSIENGEILYGDYNETTGLERNLKSPELYASYTRDWRNGARISIKGLNGEIISGIIDSDTALANVTKELTSGITYIDVDDISKLSVNDKIKIWDKTNNHINPKVFTISNIDSTLKRVTLTENIDWNLFPNKHCIIEVTESSSSPVVKTQDGTVVSGTWTGLGTNEATFTLGDNSNITGKDLYVEYSLIIPNNNSDFNELPYSIDKAYTENGMEMAPVDKVLISDDFKGKISNSTKECPHFAGFYKSNALASPNSFTEYKSYNILYYEDGTLASLSTTESGEIPQNIFSFNLIEMVERKLGCEIPTIDKIQWLKNNLIATFFDIYGYGISPSGNKYYVAVYVKETNSWFVPWWNESSTITKISADTNDIYTPKCIDENGFIHYIAYTDSSNGTIASTIFTDYVSLKIKLKTDSTFTTLYCSNSRAREDKCNPVLIQKETKTVKRYLPSKECFTTECKYVDMDRKLLSTSDMSSYYYKGTKVYSTTRGSGEYNSHTGVYPNIINLLRIPDYEAYTYKCEPLKNSPVTAKINMSFTEQLGESYTGNTLSAMPTELYDVLKYIQLVPFIRLNNGEIELMLYTSEVVDSGIEDYSKQMSKNYVYAYKLPNRPLIK